MTGTPVKSRLHDLQGLLKFLGITPVCNDKNMFNRLLSVGQARVFRRLFGAIAIRTSKSDVAHELDLPRQHRQLVPLDFGAVEALQYSDRYSAAMSDLGVHETAAALPELAKMVRFILALAVAHYRSLQDISCR